MGFGGRRRHDRRAAGQSADELFQHANRCWRLQTFLSMAAIYSIFMIIGAFRYRLSPVGWRPDGWTPPLATNNLEQSMTDDVGLFARWSWKTFAEIADREGKAERHIRYLAQLAFVRRRVIYVMETKGKKLGRIVHGQPATTNMAFGGDDWKTLFFTSRTMIGSFNVKIPGMPVPAVKKA
jgi:hypothetical protein